MSRWLDLARAYEGGMPLQEILKTLPDNLTKPYKIPHTGENTRNYNTLPNTPSCQVTPDTIRQKVMEKGEVHNFQGDNAQTALPDKRCNNLSENSAIRSQLPFCQAMSGSVRQCSECNNAIKTNDLTPFVGFCQFCQREVPEKDQTPRAYCAENPFVHGPSPGGRPTTWTGKVVSLADWRQLSEWEKHGPNARD